MYVPINEGSFEAVFGNYRFDCTLVGYKEVPDIKTKTLVCQRNGDATYEEKRRFLDKLKREAKCTSSFSHCSLLHLSRS